MALRRPVYLDAETLSALADYHNLDVDRLTQVVEKAVKKRSANAKASFPGILSAGAEIGKDVELQTSFTITPNEKASISKAIDGLIAGGHVIEPTPNATLVKDSIIEIEGRIKITAASLAGKVLYILRRFLDLNDADITELSFDDIEPDVMKLAQDVFVRNELVPIPILVQVENTGLAPDVFVNLSPNLFVDSATSDQIEGERHILGTVRTLIPEGKDGYMSAENWLLPNWEYLMRRHLMTRIEDTVKDLVKALDIDLSAKKVSAWIKGPAVVLDAVAVY